MSKRDRSDNSDYTYRENEFSLDGDVDRGDFVTTPSKKQKARDGDYRTNGANFDQNFDPKQQQQQVMDKS